MHPNSRRGFLIALGVSGMLAPRLYAQPSAPMRIIVPFPAGGTIDVLARAIAEQLTRRYGDTVVVVNLPGASGLIGLDALKTAAPDGRTFMLAPLAVPVLNPVVLPRAGPLFGKDYLPLGIVARISYVIVVPANHPSRTIQEFFEWLRRNPDSATFGVGALGNVGHFMGEVLSRDYRLAWRPVGYKGMPPVKQDLLPGRIAASISGDADFFAEYKQGSVRALAVSTRERSPLMPDIPTLMESGIDFEATGWHGAFVPGGTPDATIQALNRRLVEVLELPQMKESILRQGLTPASGTPEQLGAQIASDIARWVPVVKSIGFKTE